MTQIERKAKEEEVARVASAEKQAIRLWRMPLFFEHPRNGKEIKDFCHFGSRKGCKCRKVARVAKVARVKGTGSEEYHILKQVIPTSVTRRPACR